MLTDGLVICGAGPSPAAYPMRQSTGEQDRTDQRAKETSGTKLMFTVRKLSQPHHRTFRSSHIISRRPFPPFRQLHWSDWALAMLSRLLPRAAPRTALQAQNQTPRIIRSSPATCLLQQRLSQPRNYATPAGTCSHLSIRPKLTVSPLQKRRTWSSSAVALQDTLRPLKLAKKVSR